MADKIREWHQSDHEIYAYFNNDSGGFALKDAAALKKLHQYLRLALTPQDKSSDNILKG